MRNYEVAYVAAPDLDEESLAQLEANVLGWISAEGKPGEIDRWGRRRLAYPIKKLNDGYYVFIKAELPPEAGAALEREMRLNEQILRFMITSQEPAAA